MHYYGDRNTMARTEETYNMAWHTGNGEGNTWYIGYEVCQSMSASDKDFLANEQAIFKQVAEDLKFYGLPANRNTVRLHREFSSTSCPHRSWALHGQSVNSVKDYFIAQIQSYMNGKKPDTGTTKPSTGGGTGQPVAGAQFKPNDKVKIASFATRYETGQPINQSAVKGKTYVIDKVKDLGKIQSKSKYSYLLKSGGTYIGWVLQQDIVGGKNAEAPKPTTPSTGTWNRTPEIGTFIPNTTVAVKPSPTVASKELATYTSGQAINYDSYINNEGYTWVSYVSYTGERRYVATRKTGQTPWGTFR